MQGGPDNHEEYYCPTVEWEWGDGTISQSSADCDPYDPEKSTIRRRHSNDHVYDVEGQYRARISLKKKDKVIASATTVVQITGGYPGR